MLPLAVLKLLSHDGFRSGEEIARALALSRAAVHQAVERARALGVAIHAVRGLGYRLAEPMSWLNAEVLQRGGAEADYELELFEEIASTNSHLLNVAQDGVSHRRVSVAELQAAGRGRRGRVWHSPLGAGLTFSLLWRFQRPLAALSGLSLAVGVALVRTLRTVGVSAARLKWPNDVLVAERKLAGILVETQGDMLGPAAAVIGIGINVQRCQRDVAHGTVGAVSLAEVLAGQPPDRNDLLLAILSELDCVLSSFDRAGFAPFVEEWQTVNAWPRRQVMITGLGMESVEGCLLGVDRHGALRLNTATGVRTILVGEVSLRPGGHG